MAVSTIAKPVIHNTVNTYSYIKAVSANTTTEVYSFTFSEKGTYLIISFMDLSASGTGAYVHTLASQTVRSPSDAGGGSINVIRTSADVGSSINIRAYVPIACTVRGTVNIIRLM